MLQIHWFQHAMTINKIELSDKPFLGNGAGGGGLEREGGPAGECNEDFVPGFNSLLGHLLAV